MSDSAVIALAAVVVGAVVSRDVVVAVGVGVVGAVVSWPPRRVLGVWLVLAVVLGGAGVVRSAHDRASLTPDRVGPFTGWVRVVTDPAPYPSSTRIILAVQGERFESWSRGRGQQERVRAWRAGDWVRVHGDRTALDDERADRVAWQHVVGEFELAWAADVAPGGPVARASNRVRDTIERAAGELADPYGALYRGLVIGDDRDQPPDMIERFRTSGLSHLTAVSGQNVAFVLAACGPLLVRLRPWPRLLLTVGVIAWFAALTRFEPSILRAGVMAALSALAFTTGRERSTVRILALAVVLLLLIDPLLAWSVGFWLSVGATAGVCVVGPWLMPRLRPLGVLAGPVAITVGAQVGVALPSLLVFGRLPLVSVVANVLAVPVAGFVMLYGLPAGLLAGAVPTVAPVVMLPAAAGTRWVDTVAHLGARLEPDPPWNWIGWLVVAVAVLVLVVASRTSGRRER